MSTTAYQIIAVDFDGTLCYSNWPELGEPNKPLIVELVYVVDGDVYLGALFVKLIL